MEVVDYEGVSAADREFWELIGDDDPALRERVERLRPCRPYWIAEDVVSLTRWAASWRVAALYVVWLQVNDEHEARSFVWHCARSLYASDIPID